MAKKKFIKPKVKDSKKSGPGFRYGPTDTDIVKPKKPR